MIKFDRKVLEALAAARADIDGRPMDESGGYFHSYMADAEELAKRLLLRGYTITKLTDE